MLLCFRYVNLFSSIGSYLKEALNVYANIRKSKRTYYEVVNDDNAFGVEMQYFLFYFENLYWSASDGKPFSQFLRF